MTDVKKQLIGPAEDQIRTLLSQSGDPLEAIRAIQKDYGLDLSGIENMYPLLELCGYSRLEIHRACLDALNKAAVEKIESNSFQLENFYDLFSKTFPYIHIPLMQPIPMALLKKFERHIEEDIIEKLKSDLDVFANCPLNIKQRIWKQDESFFQQTMIGILNEYHHNEDLKEIALNLKPDSYQETLQERRSQFIIRRIVHMINNDPQIYSMFMRMIRLVFETTPYSSLCALRVDICMSLHNSQAIEDLNRIDPCQALIVSLDKCINKQSMDDELIEEIKQCFDNVKNGSTLYADYAMVLMDPVTSNFLATNILRWTRSNIEVQDPILDDNINYNGKLLNLAEHAPSAVGAKTKIPKLDRDLKDNFWNAMSSIMIEEQTHEKSENVLNTILSLIRKSEIARKVFVQYILDRVNVGDLYTLSKCLPLLVQSATPDLFTEESSQIYIGCIYTMMDLLMKRYLMDCIMNLRWRQIIVEGFLLKAVSWSAQLHEKMVRFLAEYYSDPKNMLKLGPQSAIIAAWAEATCTNGLKDEKSNTKLKELYSYLLHRSSGILKGDFAITPPTVVKFIHSSSAQ